MRLLGLIIIIARKIFQRLLMYVMRPMFKKCGRGVLFSPYEHFTYNTIELGDNVAIGIGALFSSTESTITIGDKLCLVQM